MTKKPYLLYLSSDEVLNRWRLESEKKGTSLPCFIEYTIEEVLGRKMEQKVRLNRELEKARKKIEMLKESIVKDKLERSNNGINYSSMIEKSMEDDIEGKSCFSNDLSRIQKEVMERRALDDEWKSMSQEEIKRVMKIMDEKDISMPIAIKYVKGNRCSPVFNTIFSEVIQ